MARVGVFFVVLMLLSCDNYNFDVGLGKSGLGKDLLDLGHRKTGGEFVGDQSDFGNEIFSDVGGVGGKKPGMAVVEDKDILDVDAKAEANLEVPSIVEAIPVRGDSLLPADSLVKGDAIVAEAGALNADGVVLLEGGKAFLGSDLVDGDGNSLDADGEETHDEIKVDWLNRLGVGYKETLEYLKDILQDERYKARLGGAYEGSHEDNIKKYAYSEKLMLGFLASIGERGTQDMLTQIKHAREAVEKYSGEGDRGDILYDLESDLSYAFYQNKVYDKKPNIEVLDKIKACAESFIENINNELVLMNKKVLLSTEEVWGDKFKEHLSEDELYTLMICEILLRDKDISLKSVGDKFISLGKNMMRKTLKKLDQLISSALIKDIGGATSKKATKEKISNQLESLSEYDKRKLDALRDRLHHVFKHLISVKLSLNKMYETLQDLLKQAIKEFKEDDFKIKYAYSAPQTKLTK
ncbi:hypothetical protein [Borrelia sp. P9F1]|uniref:hypothetical protein n=1 Tax=Borrelia sp. P9F1 TaxID=3058374 RepID=UPI00264797D2|nr:hypothetical protein [Borrelia sp. P9F1]WKC58725.1 hypothetical protein QYZ68_05840 [Borrelia sp. P9F1]